MVQVVDRLVVPRAIAVFASFVALAGCQCLWLHTPGEPGEQEAMAELDSAPACPAVTKAEAWVNRMPAIGDQPTKMIVMLGVDSKDSWFLTPLDMPAAQKLILELKPGGTAVPGTVAYRQTVPAPLPAGIKILCRGSEVATIDNVMIVQ